MVPACLLCILPKEGKSVEKQAEQAKVSNLFHIRAGAARKKGCMQREWIINACACRVVVSI